LPGNSLSEIAQNATRRLRSIVIAGGGTPGWMAAAALSRVIADGSCAITLVESNAAHAVGVEGGSLPSLRAFHGLLGIEERDFVSAARATIKLGVRFRDWRTIGDTFLHPFGSYGVDINHDLIQAYWLKCRQEGRGSPLEEWSVTGLAASLGRFGVPPPKDSSALRHLSYAYHLDATLYSRFLRAYAEQRGVRRIEGDVAGATIDTRGRIESLRLADGRAIGGDFFVDCSGDDALIIAGALQSGYEDWSQWLPCDRAVTAPCAGAGHVAPVTLVTACEAGWQWRIPLQHGAGNGYAYSSAHLSDGEAAARLLERLEGAPLAELRLLRFRAGRRTQAWVGNCLALGSAAGFLGLLESTGMHLVQTGLGRLFGLFPDRDFDPAVSAEYNRLTALEYQRARDFLILHYAGSERDEAPFWRQCRGMELPETLAYKRDLFTRTGRIAALEEETFPPGSWLAIYAGLRLWPQRHEPVVDIFTPGAAAARFEAMRQKIRAAVETLPVVASGDWERYHSSSRE
jgi:tryptophan halogenase